MVTATVRDFVTTGSASGANLIADYSYDAMSRRTGLARGNGVTTAYEYTQASRLAELAHDMAGTSHDATWSFGYTDAGQISSRTLVDMYEWPVSALDEEYVANGLNQYTEVESVAVSHDARGNLINDGVRRFCYDYENRLIGAAPVATDPCTTPSTGSLAYDPLGRLRNYTASGTTTEFLYDGDRLIAEYVSGAVARRYAHGPGVDEPLVWYEGAGTTDPRWLVTDRQGSIVAATDATGAAVQTYTYGPYGEPNAWSGARFRYTGQAVLAELQLYHYKARVYDPALGRFLQTDPVGYQDDFNLYAYVGNDALNLIDPLGLFGFYFGVDVDWGGGVVAGVSLLWYADVSSSGVRVDWGRPVLVLHTGLGYDFSASGILGYTARRENLLGRAVYGELQSGSTKIPFSLNIALPMRAGERGALADTVAAQIEYSGPVGEGGSIGAAFGLDGTYDEETGVATFDARAADLSVGNRRIERIEINLTSGAVNFVTSRDTRSIGNGSRLD
ncbi:MAG: RHS repeat-associated core domain-containing protein [Hyphomonadaceae bacterium]